MNQFQKAFSLVLIALCSGCIAQNRPAELLKQMTLDEKIGQMIQVDSGALEGHEDDVTTYFIGSILSGGSSDPKKIDTNGHLKGLVDNSPQAWKQMVELFKKQSQKTRLKIPLIYGIDAVHGHNNVIGAVQFPHNIGLGATRNVQLLERMGRAVAEEVAATGIDWTFAPCVAVARNERWGRTYESFGESPEIANDLGMAFVRGLQGADLSQPTAILACAKHYVGDGGTQDGKDQGDMVCDEAALRAVHLPPFKTAIDAGARNVMISYSSWNGQKMHGHKKLITDVLKGEMQFSGFVVSDWAAIDQLPGDYKSDIQAAVNAGLDMFMIPHGPANKEGKTFMEFSRLLKELIEEKSVSTERIDDAVLRILRVKEELGLFDDPQVKTAPMEQVGSAEHRALARKCVRESLVLLRNENQVLPLSGSTKRICVAGRGVNNLGMQCGGWSISWQGESGEITTGGTTILQAVQKAVGADTKVIYSADGSRAKDADIAIVAVGEMPYAEMQGDRENLVLAPEDLQVVRMCKNAGIPVVLILLSGRPLLLNEALPLCDAIVAAWLPGTEAAGITDVLFGEFKPTGKLPCSWPASMDQIPINIGDKTYEPLFPYGFGLTY